MRNIIRRILKEEIKKSLLIENNDLDFNTIYNDLWDKMLYNVCMRYTKNVDKAQDFCQNGFIKVYKNLDKYDGSGSLEGWVRRVISNNILDELRKEKMTFVDSGDREFDFSRLDVGDDEYFEPELSMNDVKKVLPQLPNKQREAFELYILKGLKHDEIAKKLGISVGTSKSNLAKAKKKVKELIGKEGLSI